MSRISPSRTVSAYSRGVTLYGVEVSSWFTIDFDSANSTPRRKLRLVKVGTATVLTSSRYSDDQRYPFLPGLAGAPEAAIEAPGPDEDPEYPHPQRATATKRSSARAIIINAANGTAPNFEAQGIRAIK